jgi:tetratricopeptide (TPR) repeat protein
MAWVLVFCFSFFIGCSTSNTEKKLASLPIENPYASFSLARLTEADANVILRTKKGDRTLELQLPGGYHDLSDFEIPLAPDFDAPKAISGSSSSIDDSYSSTTAGFTDKQILSGLEKPDPLDDQRRAIEDQLNLVSADSPNEQKKSYLAMMDKIRQLYRLARFEAALLELDQMLKVYSMDPKLYEMRGTLLDRIGKSELALKAWNQALEFDPKNEKLKNFVEKKVSRKL